MTEDEFRTLTRDWFKDLVKTHADDTDRRFAITVGLTPTEVNLVTNDKRYPSWRMIAMVTEHLNIRTDDFFLALAYLARKGHDRNILAKGSPQAEKRPIKKK